MVAVLCLWFQNNKGVKEDITTVFLHMHYITVWTQSGTAARVPVFLGKALALLYLSSINTNLMG